MGFNYKFVTIEKLAKRLTEIETDKVIGFTNDSEDMVCDDFEPTGWYGAKISNMFDGNALLIGYFGGGIIYSKCLIDDDTESEIEEGLADFFSSEFYNKEKRKVCVDADEFDGNGNGGKKKEETKMSGDLMCLKFNSVGHPDDVVKLDEIFRRYVQINGSVEEFEEYVNSGFRNGNEVEYEEYVNNELMVDFGSSGYIYFKTKAKNCLDAATDLMHKLESVGVNTDNFDPLQYRLDNEDGKQIDLHIGSFED